MGAAAGTPDRQVVAFIGDGSFQMTIQELATIAQEQFPVKIVILNNRYLGMVRQWQELFFEKRYSFVNLQNPDFVQVAKGFYINGERVQKRKELQAAITRMFEHKGPYLLEIMVEQEQNVFPMVPVGSAADEIRLE
jgi:acetolactate synthase-1/2/3 large subunit